MGEWYSQNDAGIWLLYRLQQCATLLYVDMRETSICHASVVITQKTQAESCRQAEHEAVKPGMAAGEAGEAEPRWQADQASTQKRRQAGGRDSPAAGRAGGAEVAGGGEGQQKICSYILFQRDPETPPSVNRHEIQDPEQRGRKTQESAEPQWQRAGPRTEQAVVRNAVQQAGAAVTQEEWQAAGRGAVRDPEHPSQAGRQQSSRWQVVGG